MNQRKRKRTVVEFDNLDTGKDLVHETQTPVHGSELSRLGGSKVLAHDNVDGEHGTDRA